MECALLITWLTELQKKLKDIEGKSAEKTTTDSLAKLWHEIYELKALLHEFKA